MYPFDEKRLTDLVKNVATRVSNERHTILLKGQLLPGQTIIFRKETTLAPDRSPLDTFAPIVARSDTFASIGTTWSRGQASGEVYTQTRSSEEWIQLQNFLLEPFTSDGKISPEGVINYLDPAIQLIWHLATACSPNSELDSNKVNAVIDSFIKEIYHRPRPYIIKAELTGLALPTEPIHWTFDDYNISIRKITAEDLTSEFTFQDFLGGSINPYVLNTRLAPTAVLQIQLESSSRPDFQKIIDKALAILRLCTTGGVNCSSIYIKWDISSEWQFMFPTGSGDLAGRDRYNTVVPTGVANTAFIVRFWTECHSRVASSLVHSAIESPDYTHLLSAYRRYCSALFNNDSIESRIADIVIGLEALYFSESDNQELSNRFGNRIAKVFGVLDGDPLGFKSLLKEAYIIRSKFAHGHIINKEKRMKIERTYSNLTVFINRLLAILRRSIVLFLERGESKQNQESLITLIDDALIDSVRNTTLSEYLTNIRPGLPD